MNDNPVIKKELEKIADQNKERAKAVASYWDASDKEFCWHMTLVDERHVIETKKA